MLALMISLLTLWGCQSPRQLEQEFEDWRLSFSQDKELGIDARVSWSEGGGVSEYQLAYRLSPEEETVEILSPELIAKVKAHMEGEEPRLSYDGVILDAGGGDVLSPMTALPLFNDFITEGHTEGVWTEEKDGRELLAAELELADGSKMTLWLDGEGPSPLYAEIRQNAAVSAAILIEDIT